MNLTHLHLLLNHIPVILVPVAVGLLAWGLLARERALQRAAAVLLVLAAAGAGPVFLTGEPAEERVEHLPGVAGAAIEQHEDAAKVTLAATLLAGGMGVLLLLGARHGLPVPRQLAGTALLVAVLASIMLAATAWFGGQIRHTETQRSEPRMEELSLKPAA